MSTKECPSCAVEINRGDKICPICGYEFPARKKINIKFIGLVLLLLFIYPFIRFLINLITG